MGVVLVAPLDEADAWRDVVTQLDQGEGVRTLTYSPRTFPVKDVAALISSVVDEPLKKAGSEPTFRLVADELTGTLIVTGTASQHAMFAGIVERLDAVPPRARRQIRAFPIKNRGVREVVALIQELVDAELFEPAPAAPSPAAPPAQRSVREVRPEEPSPPAPPDADGAKHGATGTPPSDSSEGLRITLQCACGRRAREDAAEGLGRSGPGETLGGLEAGPRWTAKRLPPKTPGLEEWAATRARWWKDL
ncbi:MAG: hypothetical protein HY812_04150 [Planctomycetes bacterium]|nr:hypothetical protein [Planctomycetota bacterium]